jgi:hypothetical protein
MRDSETELEPETDPEDGGFSRQGLIYIVVLTVIFVIAGIVFTFYAFPELSAIRATVAGVCFGARI